MATSSQPATNSNSRSKDFRGRVANLRDHLKKLLDDAKQTDTFIHAVAFKQGKGVDLRLDDVEQMEVLDDAAKIQLYVKDLCLKYKLISAKTVECIKRNLPDRIRELMIQYKDNVDKVHRKRSDDLRFLGISAKPKTDAATTPTSSNPKPDAAPKPTTKPTSSKPKTDAATKPKFDPATKPTPPKSKSDAATKPTTKPTPSNPKFDPATKPTPPQPKPTDSTTDNTSNKRTLDVSNKSKSKLTTNPKPVVPTTDPTTDDDDDKIPLGRSTTIDTRADLKAMAAEINARQREKRQLAVPAEDTKSPAEDSKTEKQFKRDPDAPNPNKRKRRTRTQTAKRKRKIAENALVKLNKTVFVISDSEDESK